MSDSSELHSSGLDASAGARKRLPVNPSLENLKKQAKRLARLRPSLTLQQAQHQLAQEYGAPHWAELSHIVETMSRGAKVLSGGKNEFEPLPAAANRGDLAAVRKILEDGPFTQHDLDLALARSVLRFHERGPIARLLVEHGADPDGQYGGAYGPIVFVTGECLDPDGLEFLLDAGADVTFPAVATKYGNATPMSYVLGSYARGANERKHRCIDVLLAHGAPVPAEVTPAMMAIHHGDEARLAELVDGDPTLVEREFPDMPYGNIALAGATLLHMAVEFGEMECIDLLLDRGADLNARSLVIDGVGGQTPIYHAIASILDVGLAVLEHSAARLAANPAGPRVDLLVRATFRRFGEIVAPPISPLEFAHAFNGYDEPNRGPNPRELELLEAMGK